MKWEQNAAHNDQYAEGRVSSDETVLQAWDLHMWQLAGFEVHLK